MISTVSKQVLLDGSRPREDSWKPAGTSTTRHLESLNLRLSSRGLSMVGDACGCSDSSHRLPNRMECTRRVTQCAIWLVTKWKSISNVRQVVTLAPANYQDSQIDRL